MRLTGLDPDARAFLQAPPVAVKPGHAYVFSCWAKTEGIQTGKPVLGIARYTADGKWDNWSYALTVPRSPEWRQYRQLFIMPATTHKAAFRVWIERCEGAVWFDDVSWREYTQGKPGWVDDMRSPSPWRGDHASVSLDRGGLSLRIADEPDPMALFHLGGMEREIRVDLAGYPFLAVEVARKSGLWALKIDGVGYVQFHTHASGQFPLRPARDRVSAVWSPAFRRSEAGGRAA